MVKLGEWFVNWQLNGRKHAIPLEGFDILEQNKKKKKKKHGG